MSKVRFESVHINFRGSSFKGSEQHPKLTYVLGRMKTFCAYTGDELPQDQKLHLSILMNAVKPGEDWMTFRLSPKNANIIDLRERQKARQDFDPAAIGAIQFDLFLPDIFGRMSWVLHQASYTDLLQPSDDVYEGENDQKMVLAMRRDLAKKLDAELSKHHITDIYQATNPHIDMVASDLIMTFIDYKNFLIDEKKYAAYAEHDFGQPALQIVR